MNSDPKLKVIELRNYLLKPGARERFAAYFEDHFVDSQQVLGASVLGQFRIKGEDDRFFWIRGYEDMQSRLAFLRAFYEQGEVWKQFGAGANEMIEDSDHVYLLKPLSEGFAWNELPKEAGVVLIDVLVAKADQLEQLIGAFRTEYLPCLKNTTTLLTSEMSRNDFPRHPAIQDPNVLVAITRYASESVYLSRAEACKEARDRIRPFFVDEHSLILYPTANSFVEKARQSAG